MAESKEPVTKAALKQQVEELRHSNAVLQTENEIFESFLNRLDSLSLDSQLALPQSKKGAGQRGRFERCRPSQKPPRLLNQEQKYCIAMCEMEETRKELEQYRISLARNAEYYKAAIEDSELRLAEIKRERHHFEEFVDKIRQTTWVREQRAQKVIGYIGRKIKAKETLTERMHRRNKFLQMQNLKQQRMVHQKEQMQETPSWVDLEHLKQMNTQCQKRLQKFQAQLLNQRMLVRKGRQSLNVYKERLKKEMQESESLSRKIASHEERLSKIREKQQKVEKERVQAEALNKKLKAQLANFRVPDVMKYVEAKATNDRLRQTVKSLERKARVAEMALKTKKKSPEESSGCSRSSDH
ncbi:coiled-coil domain-containing protein 113 [Ictalurus punctatus]|uniref:Cilia- and flagella-associated protein 263 n=1 Tax=Ictalurus punctatus TaxID=7998 RepID=A0A2D0RGK7_ICTPU|nr:coiled-coil domain-containing protein 113 [Ictalurus punctatus]